MYLSVIFRVVITHPFKVIINAVVDFFKFITRLKWHDLSTGYIICFIGLFGKGKTLSAVRYVVKLYNLYNNKKIYDPARKKFVTQKIHIVSNVTLNIPYEEFVSLAQVVQIADRYKSIDEENNTLTKHIILGDEFSVQLNSRSFKSNIDPLFLNTLLTCRHHHISLIYTAQRFNHVDALLRQVTSYVVSCNKVWRIMVHNEYDAYDLENASNPLDVKPLRRFGWFIRNKHFNNYDTLACVNNLKKSCMEGDMLTEEEILNLQSNTGELDNPNPSKRFIRRSRKINGKRK